MKITENATIHSIFMIRYENFQKRFEMEIRNDWIALEFMTYRNVFV